MPSHVFDAGILSGSLERFPHIYVPRTVFFVEQPIRPAMGPHVLNLVYRDLCGPWQEGDGSGISILRVVDSHLTPISVDLVAFKRELFFTFSPVSIANLT